MPVNRTIILVDDDAAVCHALSTYLLTSGYSVRAFPSAEAFLDETEDTVEGVMLLDQRMSGMSGLELQAELARRCINLQIIFISGHADVQMSVKAVKAGAIDFLEKPFSQQDLLASIKEAFSRADDIQLRREDTDDLMRRHANLTPREQEVLQHVVTGMSNKRMAEVLCVSDRTIEVHRSRVMKKMKAESLPDLVRKYAMWQKSGQ